MSKAGQRRMRHLAEYLTGLARTDCQRFQLEWHKRLGGWLAEVARRGKRLRAEETEEAVHERVFAVLEQVNKLLALCGPEVERLVGAHTRDAVAHECCKALALAVAPEMYKLSIKLR